VNYQDWTRVGKYDPQENESKQGKVYGGIGGKILDAGGTWIRINNETRI
jgi:hypothetical protein